MRIKSIVAKVTLLNKKYRIYGAAWGARIKAVIDRRWQAEHAWKIWYLDWKKPSD